MTILQFELEADRDRHLGTNPIVRIGEDSTRLWAR